jgi:hypothetical protein
MCLRCTVEGHNARVPRPLMPLREHIFEIGNQSDLCKSSVFRPVIVAHFARSITGLSLKPCPVLNYLNKEMSNLIRRKVSN